eukprot:s1_g781.t1
MQQKIVDPIFGRPAIPYLTKGRAEYYIEPSTKLVFQKDLPSVEEMEEFVQQHYKDGLYKAYNAAKPLKYETGRRRLDEISAYGLKGQRYLDVGCATGIFLEVAQDQGFDVTGIELSEEASLLASDAVKNKIVVADVNNHVREAAVQYDLVTAYDIIEHVQDPREFVRDLKGALAPGGVLALATPDTDHYLRWLMGRSWPMLQPMQHTFMFSEAGIKELLEDAGFRDVQVSAAKKVLTLEYLFEQVGDPSPTLGKFLVAFGKLLPKAIKRRPIGLNISEMFVLARRD